MRTARIQSGFTLLEMLVSLAIFTVVAVFAVGSLVRITALNRQSQTLQASMNNLSFALESISREMRVGKNYTCETGVQPSNALNSFDWSSNLGNSATCPINPIAGQPTNTDTVVAFTSSNTDPNVPNCFLIIAYDFHYASTGWTIQKAAQPSCHAQPDQFVPIIDTGNITITGFSTGVYHSASPYYPYSWAFLRLKGFSGVRVQDQNQFDIQTAVSERLNV